MSAIKICHHNHLNSHISLWFYIIGGDYIRFQKFSHYPDSCFTLVKVTRYPHWLGFTQLHVTLYSFATALLVFLLCLLLGSATFQLPVLYLLVHDTALHRGSSWNLLKQ